jgi:hypothetical protein
MGDTLLDRHHAEEPQDPQDAQDVLDSIFASYVMILQDFKCISK